MSALALLDSIRDHVRSGAFAKAKSLIRAAARARLSRPERLRLAFYANEVFMASIAVGLLHRRVRPQRTKCDATDEELAEYGLALGRMGSLHESIELLSSIDLTRLPRAANTLALAHIHRWDYEPVIRIMQKVLRNPRLSEFDQLLAQEHLATGLLQGRKDFAGAERLLKGVLAKTSPQHFWKPHMDAVYMLMQAKFYQKQWDEALRLLDRADSLVEDSAHELYPLSHQKWRTIIALSRGENVKAGLRRMEELRTHFKTLGSGREYRSCDFLQAMALKDRALAIKVYFGSPFDVYRARILRELGMTAQDVPAHFDLEVGPEKAAHEPPFLLEVINGASPKTRVPLKVGQIQQRLLHALVSDFYNPPDAVQLFAFLYPKEHFNPSSSSLRVSQALLRLRAWLKQNRIPLTIEARTGVFRLAADRRVTLRIARELIAPVSQESLIMNELLGRISGHFGDREFTAQEVERLCRVSRSLAVAWLRGACQSGVLQRWGAGPATRYSLK